MQEILKKGLIQKRKREVNKYSFNKNNESVGLLFIVIMIKKL